MIIRILMSLKLIILFFFFLIINSKLYAGCEDLPSNEVDWTNCNFIEQVDLSGVTLANAKMTGVNLALVNLEKSQINTADMSYGNFIFANFNII